jgi:hypothetical protein
MTYREQKPFGSMARLAGFEPATFCSGGVSASFSSFTPSLSLHSLRSIRGRLLSLKKQPLSDQSLRPLEHFWNTCSRQADTDRDPMKRVGFITVLPLPRFPRRRRRPIAAFQSVFVDLVHHCAKGAWANTTTAATRTPARGAGDPPRAFLGPQRAGPHRRATEA